MQNKLCIIASWFLFSGACLAVSPASAMVAAKPATSFMQRMPELVKDGGYFGSYLLLYSISQVITSPIKSYFSKSRTEQDAKQSGAKPTGKTTYIAQAFDFTADLIADIATDSWALSFFFQQKKHPFHYYFVSSLTKAILSPLVERTTDFCLSNITNATRRALLLSLGLAIPTIACAGYSGERLTCATTRSLTGIKEDPLFSFKIYLCIALARFVYPLLCHPSTLGRLDGQLDELEKLASTLSQVAPVTEETWEALVEQVDAVGSFLTNKEYSREQLDSKNLLPQTVIDDYDEKRVRAYAILRDINRTLNNSGSARDSRVAKEPQAKKELRAKLNELLA